MKYPASVVFVLLLLLGAGTTIGADTGTLTVFVLKDGKPLGNIELVVNGGAPFFTDSDGWAKTTLPEGKHQLQVFGQDLGDHLGYAKKPFDIIKSMDTQVITSFEEDNQRGFFQVDTPVKAVVVKASTAFTGAAILSGKVLSSDNQSPVKGARVFVKGTATDVRTDENGAFRVAIPADSKVSISVVHSEYSAQTLNNLIASTGKTIDRTIELTPASMELEEFVVLAPNVEGSIATVMKEKRQATSVAEILGAEQFSKQGDSSAASALRRATGLTLIGGKYIYVRGLGERYSNSRLNEMSLPSPNPTQRIVPLDMFPTSVVGSIKVQKTYSAELPANFGGGNIDIRTKDTPDDFFANIDASLSYTDGTTFEDMKTYEGGSTDFLGYDDARELSAATRDKVDFDQNVDNFDKDVASDLLKNPSKMTRITAIPGFKLSGTVGDSYSIPGDQTLGVFASYSYSQDWDSRDLFTRVATFDTNGNTASVSDFQDATIYKKNYAHGGLLGLTLDRNENHRYKFTSFYINIADDSVNEKHARSDGDTTQYTTSWFQRSLLINQISGMDMFDSLNGLKLEWAFEQGAADANEPLTKSFTFKKSDEVDFYVLHNNKINYQNNEVSDSLLQTKVDVSYPFSFFSDEDSILGAGIMTMNKDRDAESRRFALFFDASNQFMNSDLDTAINQFGMDDFSKVNLSSRPTESYSATHDISAFYLKANLKPTEKIEIILGARRENSTQTVTSRENGAIPNELISDITLPSLNATYHLNEDMQVRFGYSKTVTRPDFREFANTRFQDPLTSDISFGNEFLTYSDLTHFDLRYEWYMNDSDHLTIGLFNKKIDNPIETVVFFTDVNPLFTYLNAKDATLDGVEISGRINLGLLSGRLDKFTLAGNVSHTQSEINIFEDLTGHISDSLKTVVGDLTTKSRAMQGQSSEVINLQLGYNDEKLSASLLYNMMGRRIVNLGTEGFPDMYEQPFNQLDLVTSFKVSDRLKIGFNLKNILDDEVTWEQGGVVVRKYKKNRAMSVKAAYQF